MIVLNNGSSRFPFTLFGESGNRLPLSQFYTASKPRQYRNFKSVLPECTASDRHFVNQLQIFYSAPRIHSL